MARYKRKGKLEDITDKSGSPTKKQDLKKAQEALAIAREVTKNKPIRIAPKGESEFSRKLEKL